MPKQGRYDADIIAKARHDYVAGVAAEEIAAAANVSTGTLYKWLAGRVPGAELPPIPRRRPGVRRLRPLKTMRMALVTRLWHAAEQQVHEIETRMAAAGLPPADRERDARALAVLVKTLRELALMDHRDEQADTQPKDDGADDDVRDIDEFRRDLARQMDAIIARRTARGAGGTAPE
jgi:hypothetical protein